MDTPVEPEKAQESESYGDEAIWTGETLNPFRSALTAEPDPAA
jgi:hypothetical protein